MIGGEMLWRLADLDPIDAQIHGNTTCSVVGGNVTQALRGCSPRLRKSRKTSNRDAVLHGADPLQSVDSLLHQDSRVPAIPKALLLLVPTLCIFATMRIMTRERRLFDEIQRYIDAQAAIASGDARRAAEGLL